MAKDFSREFYNSQAWRDTREAYKKSKGGLCERCLKRGLIVPAEIVHHRIRLDETNISDPRVALSWENLEALCADCHAKEHLAKKKRYTISEDGRVQIKA